MALEDVAGVGVGRPGALGAAALDQRHRGGRPSVERGSAPQPAATTTAATAARAERRWPASRAEIAHGARSPAASVSSTPPPRRATAAPGRGHLAHRQGGQGDAAEGHRPAGQLGQGQRAGQGQHPAGTGWHGEGGEATKAAKTRPATR